MDRLPLWVLLALSLLSASVLSIAVFSSDPEAHMLLRSKRANSFMEEMKAGNLERECVEEKCDFEEAREIFQTREATLEFWTKYIDGDQCNPNPCVNGTCVDLYQQFDCRCHPEFEGKLCDYRKTATNCSTDNGDCDQMCTDSEDRLSRTCGCIKGYRLQPNSRTCLPINDNSCGQLLIARTSYSGPPEGLVPWMVGGEVGKKGESPWQVLILNAMGKFHCGGVLIDQNWVLTAAHCLTSSLRFHVRLGDYERMKKEDSEVTIRVAKAIPHPKYNGKTVDNDIALLRLSTPVQFTKYIIPACLPERGHAERVLHANGTLTVVTGWGKDDTRHYSTALNVIEVPLVDHKTCSRQMTNNVTENVLCAGELGKRVDACEGDSGGPMVTRYRNTWFLIGLVSWGEGCGKLDKFGVYTKVSNYNKWIDSERDGWDQAGP